MVKNWYIRKTSKVQSQEGGHRIIAPSGVHHHQKSFQLNPQLSYLDRGQLEIFGGTQAQAGPSKCNPHKSINQGWISLQCLHLRGWILVPLCRKYRITSTPMCLCPPKQIQPVPSRDVCNMAQSGCQMEFLVETQAQAGPSECGPLNKHTRV